jgi:hypothetical protein
MLREGRANDSERRNVIGQPIASMRNEDLCRIERPQQLEHALTGRRLRFAEAVIHEVEVDIVDRRQAESYGCMSAFFAPDTYQFIRLYQTSVRGTPVRHDHNPHSGASGALQLYRAATSEYFVIRMRREHQRAHLQVSWSQPTAEHVPYAQQRLRQDLPQQIAPSMS